MLFKICVYLLSVIACVLYAGPNMKKRFTVENAYAVITGGKSNIGKGYAEQFKKQGLNLLLIARTFKKYRSKKR